MSLEDDGRALCIRHSGAMYDGVPFITFSPRVRLATDKDACCRKRPRPKSQILAFPNEGVTSMFPGFTSP